MNSPTTPSSPPLPPATFVPPDLSDAECAQFGGPGAGDVQRVDHLAVGDEVNVVIRGRVVERGGEMCTIDLVELLHQNRIREPLLIPMPIKEVRSRPIERSPDNKGIVSAMKKPVATDSSGGDDALDATEAPCSSTSTDTSSPISPTGSTDGGEENSSAP